MSHGRPKFPITSTGMAVFAFFAVLLMGTFRLIGCGGDDGVNARGEIFDCKSSNLQTMNLPVCEPFGQAGADEISRPTPDFTTQKSRGSAEPPAGTTCSRTGRPAGLIDRTLDAIEQVENAGPGVLGDGGKSRGPFQIGRLYWKDSGIDLPYLPHVDNAETCRQVVLKYWSKNRPAARPPGDVKTLAAVHNGGPRGIFITNSDYARRVENLTRANERSSR